jgi:Fic family protein
MHHQELNILPTQLLSAYLEQLPAGMAAAFDNLKDAELSTPEFQFYTSVASVFSSRIEGEAIDLDSYIKHRRFGISFQPDYTRKIDDLYSAYAFAGRHNLNPTNLAEAHRLLSMHLLPAALRGTYRSKAMFVTTDEGRIEYVAAPPEAVNEEMTRFEADLGYLTAATLSLEEVFFFASLLHLMLVKIHPWNDGNGRTARLLEKWFLAHHLGEKAWFLQSEKMYYLHHATYYRNLRALGLEYQELDFSQALPFLRMLPEALFSRD